MADISGPQRPGLKKDVQKARRLEWWSIAYICSCAALLSLVMSGSQALMTEMIEDALGLVAPILFVSIQMGSTIALKAFAATIIGGFGDVAGAIIGGLALGIIETFGAAYISVPYKDGFAFLVLVAFLVFRPQGIFGERVAEKA